MEFRYGQDGRSALGYPSNRHLHPASTQPVPFQPRMAGSLPWCSNVTPRPNAYAGVCSVPTPLTQYSPQAPQPAPPNQYPTAPQSSTHTSQAQPYTPAPAASPPSVPQYQSASLGYPPPRLPSGNQTQGPLDPFPASGASSLGMRSSHSPLENHKANTTSVVNITTAAAATTLSSTTASNTERALQTVLAGIADRGQGDMKTAGTLLVNPLPPTEQVTWVPEGHLITTVSAQTMFKDVSVGMATQGAGDAPMTQSRAEFNMKTANETTTGSWGRDFIFSAPGPKRLNIIGPRLGGRGSG
ncbi:uncharacterized protein LOC135509879 [Oncorhynchus masou masou]|uniref:uncharacterized protein LOC135509879 n=1 Tax=Oncorhynchus masou masou TaxID=90313 RepID=UPI0031836CBF